MKLSVLLLLLLAGPLMAQQWQVIDAMPTARAAFAMSQISKDTLMLIGGRNNSGVTTACDLFSISKRTWIPTGSLQIPRQNMPSVLLPDGNVYVPSGLVNTTDEMTTTSEIYDRSTRSWSFTTDVLEAREANPALLLPNGKILIPSGALAPFGPYRKTCELYDPVTKLQTFTGSITTGQFGITTFLSGDSIVVLVSDHYNGANGTWVNETEEYDIATGQWKLAAHSQEPHGCWMDQTLQLPNGEIVAPSGGRAPNTASDLVEVYNPQTKTWRVAGKLPHPRYLGATVYLGGDSIMVIGGYEPSTRKALRECTIFNIATGQSRSGPLLNAGRYFHRTHVERIRDIENPCCEELRIFVFGGENEQGIDLASCEMLVMQGFDDSPLTFEPSMTIQGNVCDGIDTTITFKNTGCSTIIVDSVTVNGLNGVVTGFPAIVKLNEDKAFSFKAGSLTGGTTTGVVRIYYRSTCTAFDTSISITATFSTSTKGTIRPIISDVPNGTRTVDMPLYLVNNSGDPFSTFEISLGFDNTLLEALTPNFAGTLAEGATLADVTKTATGATIYVAHSIALSVSKPLCILRFTSYLADTTCTTVRLEDITLEDASGDKCVYAVLKDSAIICQALAVSPNEQDPCVPKLDGLVFDRGTNTLRFSITGCATSATMLVYDILGKSAMPSHTVSVGYDEHLSVAQLPNGIYSLMARTEDGISVSKILIVR